MYRELLTDVTSINILNELCKFNFGVNQLILSMFLNKNNNFEEL